MLACCSCLMSITCFYLFNTAHLNPFLFSLLILFFFIVFIIHVNYDEHQKQLFFVFLRLCYSSFFPLLIKKDSLLTVLSLSLLCQTGVFQQQDSLLYNYFKRTVNDDDYTQKTKRYNSSASYYAPNLPFIRRDRNRWVSQSGIISIWCQWIPSDSKGFSLFLKNVRCSFFSASIEREGSRLIPSDAEWFLTDSK